MGICKRWESTYPQLLLCPCVQGGRPDEGEVHSQAAVHAGTCQAYEHTIRDRCPRWVLCWTVKAHLRSRNRGANLEYSS